MKAIFKREFRSYFHTVIGPVCLAAIFAFIGIFFVAYNMVQGYPYFAPVLSSLSIILLLIVPIITMRSFAEEKRTKTDQLLLTAPVSVTEIVMGKYLSMIAIPGICLLVSCLGPIVIRLYGGGALLADYSAIFAFFLMTAAYMAIGMFISSLTESQVLAAVGTFVILLVLQLVDGLSSMMSESAIVSLLSLIFIFVVVAVLLYLMTKNIFISEIFAVVLSVIACIVFFVKKTLFEGLIGDLLSSLSLVSRFDDIVGQTLDITTIVYYITIAAVFVFLTVQSIQKRRWS